MKRPHTTEAAIHLRETMRSLRRALMYCMAFSFAINMLSLMLPIYSLQVFDRVFTTRSVDTLMWLTVVVFAAYAFYGLLFATRAGVLSKIVAWLDKQLTFDVFETALRASAHNLPVTAGQPLRELAVIKQFLTSGVPTLMDVPWSLLFVFVIYMINPLLGLMALGGMGIFVLASLVNEYATRKALLRAVEQQTDAMLNADAISKQAEAIQAMGMGNGVLRSWRKQFDTSLAWQEKAQRRASLIQGTVRAIRLILQIIVTGVGAYLTLQNEMTPGGLIASTILIARALAPFEGMIMLWKQLVQAREAYTRLEALMRETPEKQGDTIMPEPKGSLQLENLFFAPPQKPAIIKGANFSLKPGEMLGIIGPAGAGKTTLSKLLMGILPPSSGSVRLDGVDVYGWSREDFGKYAGYLPQSVELFPGTIKENIARMQADATDESVVQACQRAHAHELILRLPQGYDTPYIPGVSVLSPGQKQRIGLARALYGTPKYVVLDEPNSNLDGEGERALIHTLVLLKKAKITTLIIAHRPSILTMVDTILMIRDGVIEAIGPRDDMLQRYSGGNAGNAKQGEPATEVGRD
jgi:PrtD family type I secretion system ABC transporter